MALILIVHARVPQKRFAPRRLEFFIDFVWKRATVYPRGGVRTVSVANPTNGYAAEKSISKVISDGEWKPLMFNYVKTRFPLGDKRTENCLRLLNLL